MGDVGMSTEGMRMLLSFLLASYAVGVVLPFCVPRNPQAQGIVGSICACVASRYCQLKSNRADFLP
ncbi:MAG: hypothetical protein AAB177_01400, partial [Nitrospirota bacterium]